MQQTTASPRSTFTAAQVEAIITGDDITVDAGCELLDNHDAYVSDISADLVADGSSIERQNYRTVHGTSRLVVSSELQWGWHRLKPYLTISDHVSGLSARFNLGVYVLSTPKNDAGGFNVRTWQVDGFDKLAVLDTPVGSTYRIAAGAVYLTEIATLIGLAGETKIRIDQAAIAKTLPADRVWAIDEKNTYLALVNDLLDAVGYRGLWCDEDGYYRSEAYVAPAGRSPEWTYDAQDARTIVGEDRESDDGVQVDSPNRWVFMRDDPTQAIPVAGDGLYVVTNQSDGRTSIDARGRTITARPCPIRLDGADQASFVAIADRYVVEAKQEARTFRIATGPNPLHGHFDVVRLVDTDLQFIGNCLSTKWTLPLDGGDMAHELKAV